jgi:hypothetical protein
MSLLSPIQPLIPDCPRYRSCRPASESTAEQWVERAKNQSGINIWSCAGPSILTCLNGERYERRPFAVQAVPHQSLGRRSPCRSTPPRRPVDHGAIGMRASCPADTAHQDGAPNTCVQVRSELTGGAKAAVVNWNRFHHTARAAWKPHLAVVVLTQPHCEPFGPVGLSAAHVGPAQAKRVHRAHNQLSIASEEAALLGSMLPARSKLVGTTPSCHTPPPLLSVHHRPQSSPSSGCCWRRTASQTGEDHVVDEDGVPVLWCRRCSDPHAWRSGRWAG